MTNARRIWRYNWVIITAIVVHGLWGVIILFDSNALNCTPIATSPLHHSQWLAGTVYLTATALAIWHMIVEDIGFVALLKVLPQQTLLMSSAAGAIVCVLNGHYADGVPRDWGFILADQLWNIVGMIGHTLALIDWFYWSRIRR